jgi:hypothetical protein
VTASPIIDERPRIAAPLLAHPFLTSAAFRTALGRTVDVANSLVDVPHALLVDGEVSEGRWIARVLRARDRVPYDATFGDMPDAVRCAALAARCVSDALLCGAAAEAGEHLPSLFGVRSDRCVLDGDVDAFVELFKAVEYDARHDLEAKRLVGLTILDVKLLRSRLVDPWNRLFRTLPGDRGLVQACFRKGRLEIVANGDPVGETLERWVRQQRDAPTGVVVASALFQWVTTPPGD